jgi:hypothetical protein
MMRELVAFLTSAALFTLVLFGAAVLLTGCSELKYAECIARDRTNNPCQ